MERNPQTLTSYFYNTRLHSLAHLHTHNVVYSRELVSKKEKKHTNIEKHTYLMINQSV